MNITKNMFMRGVLRSGYSYKGDYGVLSPILHKYIKLYNFQYPLDFKKINQLLLSLAIDMPLGAVCQNCFNGIKDEISVLFLS